MTTCIMLRCRAFEISPSFGRHLPTNASISRTSSFTSGTKSAFAPTRAAVMLRLFDDVGISAGLDQGSLEPGQVHVFAGDHVLIRVVELVVRHEARHGHMPLAHRQLFAVERTQRREKVVRLHVFCFCLQAMHTRVQGMASRRAGAMGSPQSRQIPYVPFSIRYSASSMA